MNYQKFKEILEEKIFNNSNSKKDLIEKIANDTKRYTGLFRPTKPHTKIIQNLTQSNEILFGNAFENIIENYLIQEHYKILEKTVIWETQTFELDQIAQKDDSVIFVEQKMRDDHDSSKKRGQISNFSNKIKGLQKKYPNQTLSGFFYFIDPTFTKNKSYYIKELKTISKNHTIDLHLAYGEDFFNKLSLNKIWKEIENHLLTWKKSLPNLPTINFDSEAEFTFHAIKDIDKIIFKKFFNDKIIEEIWPILFPEKKTLKLLRAYFKNKGCTVYNSFVEKIDIYLK